VTVIYSTYTVQRQRVGLVISILSEIYVMSNIMII